MTALPVVGAVTGEQTTLCPKCGNEEWDHVTAERGRERDVPFNHCPNCDHEWAPTTTKGN